MKFKAPLLLFLLLSFSFSAEAARDLKAELEQVQQQRLIIKQAQQALNDKLGEVGRTLKKLDMNLLQARKAYRSVRKQIRAVDEHLAELAQEKNELKKSIERLHKQMIKEATAAYQHSGSRSVWVDVLSNTSITEIPHRQFMLKNVMLSQEKDREAWRLAMEKLALIESEEQANRERLLALQQERKEAEDVLVQKVAEKKSAAKELRSSLSKQKEQDKRLEQQQQALQRMLSNLSSGLRASDKNNKMSIRKKKGRLQWPLQGRIVVGFGKTTLTGKKLAGVHLSPKKRTELGKAVHAFGQGQVRYADWFGGYGLMMIVDYGHGIMAVYAHNDALHKQLGDWVEKGDILAEAGSTGWIEDTRLYFEVRDNGKPVNPKLWCKK